MKETTQVNLLAAGTALFGLAVVSAFVAGMYILGGLGLALIAVAVIAIPSLIVVINLASFWVDEYERANRAEKARAAFKARTAK